MLILATKNSRAMQSEIAPLVRLVLTKSWQVYQLPIANPKPVVGQLCPHEVNTMTCRLVHQTVMHPLSQMRAHP